MQRLPLVGLLACLVPACHAADSVETWTRFRGPNGSGISADTGFPIRFGKNTNMVWRTAVRPGKSSPVLTSRHIFLTAAGDGKLYTLCFERATGKLLWERSIDRPRTEVANRLNNEAAPSPVTDGDNVYAFFKDFGLVAYDSSGNLLWKAALGPFNNSQGAGVSPIMAGDSVILLADQWENSYIAAFHPKSGEMRWKVERTESEAWGSPVLTGSGDIITVSRGQFGVHRRSDGYRLMTLLGLANTIVGSPVRDGDTVYGFGYGAEGPSPFANRLRQLDKNNDGKLSPDEYGNDPVLHAIGRNSGNRDGIVTEEKWAEFGRKTSGPNCLFAVRLEKDGARQLWRYDKNYTGVIPSVLAYQNVLYLVRNGGILTTHDAVTGKVIKSERIPGALGGYASSPVAAEGKVWIASEEGKISVLGAGGEWEVLAVNDLGEACYATPALSKGTLYVRTDEALYAFRSTSK